jgi:hypothetical protein
MAYVIAIVLILVIVAAYLLVNRAMAARVADKHGGDTQRALDDEREPIPSTHLITDDERPMGDTPEAHDEVNPRDIPKDNPARQEAEAHVGDDDDAGETKGNAEGAQGGPAPSSTRAE